MELNQLYHQTSEQTQNRLQEILRTFDFEYSELYNIADKKTKKSINTYIEEWQNKGLFINNRLSSTHSEINNLTQSDMTQFGLLANDIYKRTRVKNSEILMLLILSAYIEEQKKIVDCLLTMDEVIKIKKQKLETWKTIKKGLLQQMFV